MTFMQMVVAGLSLRFSSYNGCLRISISHATSMIYYLPESNLRYGRAHIVQFTIF